jgi:hypothetical protein
MFTLRQLPCDDLIQAENNTIRLMIIRRQKLKGLSLCAKDAGEYLPIESNTS